MSRRPSDRARPALLVPAALLGALLAPGAAPASAQEGEPTGKAVYDRWCAGCHGEDGSGNGPAAAYMLPPPRDLTRALYQVRTTPSGELPTDEDILHVIDVGMPGTAMPGWEELLSRQERADLVTYVKSLSRFFEASPAPEPMEFSGPPRATEEAIAEGREFYERIECWKCHGQEGRGDGESTPTLEDDGGHPIAAADLTEPWNFNGGGSAEEIYRRLRTGLDGTPMASFSDLIAADFMTDEQLWNVAHYVRSLAPERPPRVREVVRAGLVEEGPLPESPTDSAWADAERFYIPMVGQIIVQPRWFAPRVDGLWVQALHDGEELTMLVSWSDPSESPDPVWAPWREAVVERMEPKEGGPGAGPHPDRVVVQFPPEVPQGMERPYFLFGDASDPVYLWSWRSGEGAQEMTARGIEAQQAQPSDGQQVTATATWEAGRWRVLFRRALETGDDGDLRLPVGQAVPVAFFAWDGDNGEAGARVAISSWYFLALEQATPVTVFVTPAIALLLTAALGVFIVSRAQKRERESDAAPTTTS